MPAIPYSDTAVVDGAWDGPGNEAKLSNDAGAATYRKMYAWVDSSKDANTKAAYKFPHHFVSDGTPGAASVAGVRAGLARAAQSATNIPAADVAGVKGHLQKHLDKFNAGSSDSDADDKNSSSDDFVQSRVTILDGDDIEALAQTMIIEVKGRILLVREEIVDALSRLHGQCTAAQTFRTLEAAARTTPDAKPKNDDTAVKVIPLQGVLRPTPSLLALLFGGGGGGLLGFRQQLRDAAKDPKVSAIVMDVNSPGGFVDMIPEVAADIRTVRATKPVVAVANTTAGSAAYWLTSQASQVVVSPSGELGSIGVYQVHEDMSGAMAKEGIAVTIVKAGKYKVEGHPFAPLSDEAMAAMQSDVNDYYDMFTADVAKGRGVTQDMVQQGFGEGRMVMANRAVKQGLADKVEQLGDTVKRLAHPGARAALQRADAEALEIETPEALPPPSEDKPVLSAEDRDRVLSVLAG
jgi:signal peptide peptidase SppA